MQHQHFGFTTKDVYTLHIDLQMEGYKLNQVSSLYRQLRETLGQIPGVVSVSNSVQSPMDGGSWNTVVAIEGQPAPSPGSGENDAGVNRVSPAYFQTIGSKILQGRPITEEDTASTRAVAVVNQAFARKFFKGRNALGKHFGR